MQIEGTRQAFNLLIQERGIYKRLGVDRSTVATWKIYLNDGKKISLDKMNEILIRGGAEMKQDALWEIKYDPQAVDFREGLIFEIIKTGQWVVICEVLNDSSCTLEVNEINQIYSRDIDGLKINYIFSNNYSVYNLDEIGPVLITEEWLKILGFTKRDNYVTGNLSYKVFHKLGFECSLPSSGVLKLTHDKDEVLSYVNELQDAFFERTGQELRFI